MDWWLILQPLFEGSCRKSFQSEDKLKKTYYSTKRLNNSSAFSKANQARGLYRHHKKTHSFGNMQLQQHTSYSSLFQAVSSVEWKNYWRWSPQKVNSRMRYNTRRDMLSATYRIISRWRLLKSQRHKSNRHLSIKWKTNQSSNRRSKLLQSKSDSIGNKSLKCERADPTILPKMCLDLFV